MRKAFGSIARVALFAILAALNALGADSRRVLLINSFGREFAPFDAFAGTFRTELVRQCAGPVDIFEVSLESARLGSESPEAPTVEYLLALFSNRRLDLIVPIGGPAVRFAQRHRERLFPATPMLLTAVDERHLRSESFTTNDAVVAVRNDPAGVVQTMLHMLPQTTNIAVVVGSSSLEQFWLTEMRHEFRTFTNRVSLEWMNALAFPEMVRRCAQLPPHSAILYAILAVDAEGVPHMEERSLAELRATANAPIFGIHDTQLGRGIVGGPLMEIGALSRNSGRVAARILAGEAPGNVTTPPQEPGVPTFDWRELRHWGIRESDLPAGSRVMFREPNPWDRYRGRIIVITSVCVGQAFLIFVLLRNLSRRRRAERSLVENRNRLRAILDTAVEGIITIDERGIIESVNAAATAMFGYSGSELIGKDARILVPRFWDERQDKGLADHRTEALGVHREVEGRRRDGTVFPVDLAVSEVTFPSGRVFNWFARDITGQKQAEQAAREFGGRLLQAQEAERARLARELHDDLTQRLAMLAIDAGRTEAVNGGTMREVRDGLVRLSEDVHSLSYRLHPALLEDLGLAEALEAECGRFSRLESLSVQAQIGETPADVSPEVGLCLFRVAQEALRNVVRHARAGSAVVSLRSLDGGLQLAVTDAGVGFDPRRQRGRHSLGLASMRERVRLLGGELDIESAPGQGTSVVAWVPLRKREQ